ncbi:MAG: hypothetical protein IKO98_04255 [Bacteroidales bacterium]|nr:hypothetical protein [Bacteroidales bacterium]
MQEKKKLMDYMKAAIDLETEVETQKSIIQAYNENSQKRKPILRLKDEPSRPMMPDTIVYHGDWSRNSADTPTYLLVLSIFLLMFGLPCIFIPGTQVWGVILVISGICCLIPFIKKRKLVKQINNSNFENYHSAMDNYNKAIETARTYNANARESYNQNINLWNQNTNDNLMVLSQNLNKTQSLLNALYAKDFIYPKYHNLPALSSIYEYLITGRCDELTGPQGAYNLYEDEVRKDTVISQLNVVIENLEQIKNNQYMLYQQAKKITQNTAAIKNELSSIRGYTIQLTQLTALNTYYSSLTASNTGMSATFHLLNG